MPDERKRGVWKQPSQGHGQAKLAGTHALKQAVAAALHAPPRMLKAP